MNGLMLEQYTHMSTTHLHCATNTNIHLHVHDGTYRVILRIVKTGCHPVAIAQVVEH